MKNLLKKYRNFLFVLLGLLLLSVANRVLATKALDITLYSFKEMLFVIPPVFLLLGLLDVWVPKQTMTKYMGPGSGLKGILLSIFIGSAAAGPLYGAFPVAAVFMKKGVSFRNVLVFIGAWSTTKIPMFLFEVSSLSARFAVARLLVDIPGIILIATLLSRLISPAEVKKLYENAALVD